MQKKEAEGPEGWSLGKALTFHRWPPEREEGVLKEGVQAACRVGKHKKTDSLLKSLKRPADTLILTSETHFRVLNSRSVRK